MAHSLRHNCLRDSVNYLQQGKRKRDEIREERRRERERERRLEVRKCNNAVVPPSSF